jgi:hypothetical protein
MNPKPPVPRTSRSGWLGRKASRLKSLAAVGAVTLGFAGAALAAAGPASADPAFTFVGVGSDTTQNAMDAFAGATGFGIIGSYDAVNPVSQTAGEVITPGVAQAGGAQQNCSFNRPNGSGAGFRALDFSYTQANFTITGPPQQNCLAFSRSSGAAGSVSGTSGSPGSLLSTGNFVYVPFAIDAVTYVTGPVAATSVTTKCVSTTPGCTNGTISFTTTPTTISQTADFSVAQLQTLYGTCSPVTVGGTTYSPGTQFSFTATSASPAVFTATGSNLTANQVVTLSGTTLPGGFTAGTPYFVVAPTANTFELAATSGGTALNSTSAGSGNASAAGNIDLYAPQAGSGTLAFWQSTMGVTAPQTCWHQTVIAGPAVGIIVEEHDGAAVASDPNGIAPNSIAKWVAMSNGVVTPDVRHGSVLQSITVSGTPVVPVNGSGALNIAGCLTVGFNQATCFPITREVFNVMDFYQVVNTPPISGTINNPAFSPQLSGLFAASTSALCQSKFTIQNQGFGNIPATNSAFTDPCGSTASTLRVQMNTTAAQG